MSLTQETISRLPSGLMAAGNTKDPRGLESWPQARKGHDPDLGDLTPTTRKAQRCSPSSSIDKGVIRSHARDQEILRCFRRPHPYCYYIPFAYVLFQASLT